MYVLQIFVQICKYIYVCTQIGVHPLIRQMKDEDEARLWVAAAARCVAVCCSVLQCVAVCYSVLQCVADEDKARLWVAAAASCVAVWLGVLQCVAVCCRVLQCG